MDERIERFLKWMKGQKCGPFTLELFPTFQCNQNCVFCPRKHIEKYETPEVLDDTMLIKIINEAAKIGVKQVDLIGGGEPLARSITPEIIRLIKKHKLLGYLNTNGTMFSESLIKDMVEGEWDYIKFSLHGPDEDTHDSITNNRGAFKKVTSTLKKFYYWKKKLKKNKPVIEIGPVLCKKNYNQLIGMIELAHRFGVNCFMLQPLIKYPDVREDLSLSKDELDKLKKEAGSLITLAHKYGIITNLEDVLKVGIVERSNDVMPILNDVSSKLENKDVYSKLHCYEPWLHITIWPNGTFASCSFPGVEFRGVWEGSLERSWYSNYFETIRKNVKDGKSFEYCSRCVTNVVLDTINLKKALSTETKEEDGRQNC